MKKVWLLLFFISSYNALMAQTADAAISKGNVFYKAEQYDLAEKQYREALTHNNTNTTAQYNLANALTRQRKYDEAKKILENLLKNTDDKNIKAAAHYNEGVVYTKQKELDASIEAYKAALRINTDDKEARENLQKALLERKKQQQQKQKEQQQQNQSSMSSKQAEQKLKSLQEKVKKIQERLQHKGQKGNSLPKDW
jgi:tetratricopeptide (TPR) repeat protein